MKMFSLENAKDVINLTSCIAIVALMFTNYKLDLLAVMVVTLIGMAIYGYFVDGLVTYGINSIANFIIGDRNLSHTGDVIHNVGFLLVSVAVTVCVMYGLAYYVSTYLQFEDTISLIKAAPIGAFLYYMGPRLVKRL